MVSSAAVVSVSGRVQGVGFRAWAVRQAYKHDISGWVRNLEDGSVQIFAEGLEQNIYLYAQALQSDHPYVHVDDICIRPVSPRGYTSFSVEY